MGSATTTAIAYRLAHLGGLVFGRTIVPATHITPQSMERNEPNGYHADTYQPAPGVYSARQLVEGVSSLLGSVVLGLGHDPQDKTSAGDVLIDGLAASLATSGRESTLPLSYGPSDTSRREIAEQAQRIGKTLVKYAQETFNLDRADPNFRIRSPCEGHLWTSQVASLLFGQRSQRHFMEIYNEWLHRMILIRDSLLPFENYEDVPLLITATAQRGLRESEEPRKIFLLQCLTAMIPHSAIVDLAKVFTAPDLPSGGYGFQYSQGLILPAFLSGSTSSHLLRHHPARLEDSQCSLLFDYEHKDYYIAPCNEISEAEYEVPPGAWPPPSLFALKPQLTKSSLGVDVGGDASRRMLKLQLDIDSGICISVDIGQIARGRRYAYHASSSIIPNSSSSIAKASTVKEGDQLSPNTSGAKSPSFQNSALLDLDASSGRQSDSTWQGLPRTLLHRTVSILSQPGLVTSSKSRASKGSDDARNQIHIIPATNPVIELALLGKLYPENVILLNENETPESARKTGKGFGARFVILECGNNGSGTGANGSINGNADARETE